VPPHELGASPVHRVLSLRRDEDVFASVEPHAGQAEQRVRDVAVRAPLGTAASTLRQQTGDRHRGLASWERTVGEDPAHRLGDRGQRVGRSYPGLIETAHESARQRRIVDRG
jgi:hypothetical protein